MTNEAKLVAELERKFGQVKKTGNGWIRVPCPTCNAHNSKKFKRYISVTSRTSNCFICGVRMDIQDLLDGFYMPTYNPNEKKEIVKKEVDPRATELPYYSCIPVNQLPLDHPAVKFLYKDFLYDLDSYYNNNKIVYVPSDGGKVFRSFPPYTTSAERLIFPVYFKDKMVGWQMRSIPGTFYGDRADVVRYYHLFDKGSYLYNYDQAKKHDQVIVVEGVKKALKLPNAVATWGAGISQTQLQLIQEWKNIVMMLDGEDHNNTQKKALEFVENMKLAGRNAINIDLRDYGEGITSPDDLPVETLQNIVREEVWKQKMKRQ